MIPFALTGRADEPMLRIRQAPDLAIQRFLSQP